MGIFLDTGFYMGLMNEKDVNYNSAQEILDKINTGYYGEIYTSWFVMMESATLVAIRTLQNEMAIEKIRSIFIGDLKLALFLEFTPKIMTDTWDLFTKANRLNSPPSKKKILSLVDASNIIFCKSHGIENIVAFDGDFQGWLTQIQ